MPASTDIQTGHSATFVTAALDAQLTSINPGGTTRTVIPTTYLGSSTAHTKIPGDLVMNEPWTVELQFVPGFTSQKPEEVCAATAASCTITFPTMGGDWSAGATVTGQGFFTSFVPGTITTDELLTATATWEWSGVATYTSATS